VRLSPASKDVNKEAEEATALELVTCSYNKCPTNRILTLKPVYGHSCKWQRELLYGWRFTANQFVLATSPLRFTTSNFIFELNTCGYSSYVTSSLTRGWVCRLQFLLVFASAVILTSESRGAHDHILLTQIRDSPNLEGQVPVFISPRNRVARLYPQALASFVVASYDSQGYGGGIRPRLHTGLQVIILKRLFNLRQYGKMRENWILILKILLCVELYEQK
jgi:hypothetical protein